MPLTINDAAGDSDVTIGSTGLLDGITALVTVTGNAAAKDTLIINDSAAAGSTGYYFSVAAPNTSFSYVRDPGLVHLAFAIVVAAGFQPGVPILSYSGMSTVTLQMSKGRNQLVNPPVGTSFLADPDSVDSTIDIEGESISTDEVGLLGIDSVYVGLRRHSGRRFRFESDDQQYRSRYGGFHHRRRESFDHRSSGLARRHTQSHRRN